MNPSPLAKRLDGVSESATLKLNALVQQMKAQGVDVVNFTAGEPDFNVPEAGKQAVIDAVHANRSKYTPAPGLPELRELIAAKTNAQQPEATKSAPWKAADVIVTNGGKQAIYNAMQALLNPNDEVVIPGPYWLSYPEMAKLAGAKPVIVTASAAQDFKISPEQLDRALSTGRVKLLLFNSPSNPTGAMYSRAEFEKLGRVLNENKYAADTWILSDEIYDRIILGETPFTSFLGACPALRSRTITVNGMSKAAAMTGWRVGWSVGPQSVTQGMSTIQGQSTSGINALAQWASIAVLKLPEAEFASQVSSFRRRRDLVLELLTRSGRIEMMPPEGAFYAFVGVGKCLRPGEDSVGFAERLLTEAKVAVVPCSPFGAPEYVRLSFATDEKTLREGCERILKYVT